MLSPPPVFKKLTLAVFVTLRFYPPSHIVNLPSAAVSSPCNCYTKTVPGPYSKEKRRQQPFSTTPAQTFKASLCHLFAEFHIKGKSTLPKGLQSTSSQRRPKYHGADNWKACAVPDTFTKLGYACHSVELNILNTPHHLGQDSKSYTLSRRFLYGTADPAVSRITGCTTIYKSSRSPCLKPAGRQ